MDYALVGLGRIANKHYEASKLFDLKLKAICDLDNSKINSFVKGRINNDTSKYINYRDIIEKEQIEFVTIASSSGSHFQLTFDFLTNGINVLVEKPLSLSLRDIDLLIESAYKHRVKVMVCHQNRFNIPVRKLYESIQNRSLGMLYYGVASIRWNRRQSYYNQADWRGKWKSDGGALMNQSIHNIDLLLWMMQSPVVEVFGYIDNLNHPSIEVEDMGLALLKFANGSYGIIESSMNTYPENYEETLSIFGEKGSVVIGGKSVNKIVHWNVKDDTIGDLEEFNEEVDSVYGNGHTALYKAFIEAIEQDREPAITLQDGRNAVEVILAIYLSSFEKRPVQLPLPADTSTIMFEGESLK
jgi:predicted dehydrogenase